jgi:hypothetical protein
MSISQLLSRKPVTARLNDTLAMVAKTMKKENVGAAKYDGRHTVIRQPIV